MVFSLVSRIRVDLLRFIVEQQPYDGCYLFFKCRRSGKPECVGFIGPLALLSFHLGSHVQTKFRDIRVALIGHLEFVDRLVNEESHIANTHVHVVV